MKGIHGTDCILVVLILFGLLGSTGAAWADDGQGWLNNSATFTISPKLSLKFTQELRAGEVTYMDVFLINWQGGLVYELPRNLYAAFLYKRENTKKTTFNLAENRFTLEGGWKTSLPRNIDFDCRLRTEIRRFDGERAENHLRFRFRIRLRTRLKIGELELKPFVATEPFADTLQNTVVRNRFYLGTVLPASKHVEFVINYIRQDTKDNDPIHIFNSGIDLKF